MASDGSRTRDRAWLLFRAGLLIRRDNHADCVTALNEALPLVERSGDVVLEHLIRAHLGLLRAYDNDIHRGLHETDSSVRVLEQLDAAQRQEFECIQRVLGATIGIQGRGTVALWMAEQGQFRRADAMLKSHRVQGPVDEADVHRATGIIQAYLAHPDLARRGFVQSRERYEAIHNLGQAGSDAAWEYSLVQIPFGADQIEQRQRLARLVQDLWSDHTGLDVDQDSADAIHAIELVLSGDWRRAGAVVDRLLDRFGSDSLYSFTPMHTLRLTLARHRGDREIVWSEIRRVVPDGPESEPGRYRYFIQEDIVRLAIEQALQDGDLDVAGAWLEAYDRLIAWSGAVLGRAENGLGWARYHHASGNAVRSRQSADRALAYAANPRQPLTLIAVHRFLGHLNTLEQRLDEAEVHLQDSLRLADACAAPFERSLTLLEMAELHLRRHRPDEAMALIDEVRDICEPLGAKPTLDRVNTLLTRLDDMTDSPPGVRGGLTPREVEILQLLAQGLSNPAIGQRLFISAKTVEHHVSHILAKLAVSSRTQAATYAISQGLAAPPDA